MTSRGQLLEWLHGFDNHCSLLTQVGEPVSTARKVQKIEACCKGITGFSQELKAARAGAARANQQLDFLDLIKSSAVDGAQERTKQGPVKKAHSAAKGTDDPDQQGQQLYMLDDEIGTMRPVTMAHMATPKQGAKKGKGGKTGKAKKAQQAPAVAQPVAQQPQSTTDAPRGMCRSFYVDGAPLPSLGRAWVLPLPTLRPGPDREEHEWVLETEARSEVWAGQLGTSGLPC